MKIDSLQQSVKGPDAAAFVLTIMRSFIVHLFVLGINRPPTAFCKGVCCCSFCPKNNQELYSTSNSSGDRMRSSSTHNSWYLRAHMS